MPSPIEDLRGNILTAFERPDGTLHPRLQAAIREGRLSAEIDVCDVAARPRGPRVVAPDGELPFLQLQLVHLELLWAFIYGWNVLFEEAVQRPMLEHRWTGHIVLDTREKQRAADMLNWASSLKTGYTRWPPGFPIPDPQDEDPERTSALRANGIFQDAVSFLLYHEFAHVELGHLDFRDAVADAERRADAVQMETDADDFAFGVFVSPSDDEDARMLKGWALLTPALSSLYVVDGPTRVFQRRHPHLHHRVAHMLSRLDFQRRDLRDYYHLLSALVLSVFSNAHQRTGDADLIEPAAFDTAECALQAELDYLDRFDPEAA